MLRTRYEYKLIVLVCTCMLALSQAKQLQQHAGGDAVHIMAHVFEAGAACRLHTKLGAVLEAAEQLGASNSAQLLQVRGLHMCTFVIA